MSTARALTRQLAADVSFRVTGKLSSNQVTPDAIESFIESALARLADRVRESEDRNLLVKSFTVPVSAGRASLANFPSILVAGLPRAYVKSSLSSYPYEYQANREDLDFPPYSEFYYFTVQDNSIIVRDGAGLVPTDAGLTVECSYVPAITDIENTLWPTLVDITVELITEVGSLEEVNREAERPTERKQANE